MSNAITSFIKAIIVMILWYGYIASEILWVCNQNESYGKVVTSITLLIVGVYTFWNIFKYNELTIDEDNEK